MPQGSQIPNEVTDYYLQRVGFECEDVRLCVPPLFQSTLPGPISSLLESAYYPLLPKSSYPTLQQTHISTRE